MTGAALMLPIATIGELEPDEYVGLIDDEAVAMLAARLAVEGLLTPIWVRRNDAAAATPWSVVAGRHRLRAAMRLGWAEIGAEQRADAGSGPEELRRLQVAENLDRRDLRPIERARFVMDRWCETAVRIAPNAPRNQQSRAIRARWTAWEAISHTSESNRRLVDHATAEACGKTDRWVRIQRRLFETIIIPFPELFAPLNAHALGASPSAMNRLATIRVETGRRRAIEAVLSKPDWKTIDEVLTAAGIGGDRGFRVDPSRPDAVMLDAWCKLKTFEKKAHVEWLAAKMTPSLALAMVAGLKKRGLA